MYLIPFRMSYHPIIYVSVSTPRITENSLSVLPIFHSYGRDGGSQDFASWLHAQLSVEMVFPGVMLHVADSPPPPPPFFPPPPPPPPPPLASASCSRYFIPFLARPPSGLAEQSVGRLWPPSIHWIKTLGVGGERGGAVCVCVCGGGGRGRGEGGAEQSVG